MKTKNMVGLGLFTAIVVVLQVLAVGLRAMGLFSISLVLVPIVVGAAVYGWKGGAWLGFAFGAAVLLSGDAAAFLAVNIPGTVITVLLKGAFCGLTAGLMYKLLAKHSSFWGVVAAAVVCPIVNTGIFLLGCRVFFWETICAWGEAAGFANVGAYMIFGLTGINFLIELGVNLVLSPVAARLIRLGKRS
ncbi:MAG: ECF transporter S component [Oscillospiraceae bacterium]|nr:ECF transporter S component [Oscillospiraceae bacterium]